MDPFPIDDVLPAALEALERVGALVLTAPPGAGKSTRLPPALVALRPGGILVLQPRRVAARSLARRIAQERGWEVGGEVGWKVRFERQGGPHTRLWLMTEGTLARQLQSDPCLEGISAVVLDEFHERSLHTDVCLACLAELRRELRPDLLVVVMSATMDAAPVARLLDCPVIEATCPAYPVEIHNRSEGEDRPLTERVARVVAETVENGGPAGGDILVFLPGTGEIRGVAAALTTLAAKHDLAVVPLHGSLPAEEQDIALRPSAQRRVVLATNVAETSLTIPGIRTVIDSGLVRISRFNADTGLDELILEDISLASATQRAGRAGRTGPGRCIRLWSRLRENRMAPTTAPEIDRVDLAGTLLTLKLWHGADPRTFPWFVPPEPARLAAGEELLAQLGACAASFGAITPRGRRMGALSVHPRLAALLLDAQAQGVGRLGATLAALVSERDVVLPRRPGDPPAESGESDIDERLERFAAAEAGGFHQGLRSRGTDPIAAREVARVRDQLISQAGLADRPMGRPPAGTPPGTDGPETVQRRLLLAAYPDRVAKRSSPVSNRAVMLGGIGIEIDQGSALHVRDGRNRSELLLAVSVQGLTGRGRSSTRMRMGCSLSEDDLQAVFPGSLQRREILTYDHQRESVGQVIGWFYRDLGIRMVRDGGADPVAVAACLAQALAKEAAALIGTDPGTRQLLDRLTWLGRNHPELDLPVIDDQACQEILAQLCSGCRSRAEVQSGPARSLILARLQPTQVRALDLEAPQALTVPSGSRIDLDYSQADRAPILAVRLQELFSLARTPTVAGGRVAVILHLLGPNHRLEQITQDLAGFWTTTYPRVRKDLRARYPRHSWPEDPLTAQAEAKGRRRG